MLLLEYGLNFNFLKTISFFPELEEETFINIEKISTCSGAEINEMDCSCLADLYNIRGCSARLSYSK